MIDVGPINMWDIFKMLCTSTTVAEFNNIILKASGKPFELIQAYFINKIYTADENSDGVKAWK